MIDAKFSITTKIRNEHLNYFNEVSKWKLEMIVRDKFGFFEAVFSKVQRNYFKYLYKYLNVILCGEISELEGLYKNFRYMDEIIGTKLDLQIAEFVKKWPLKYDNKKEGYKFSRVITKKETIQLDHYLCIQKKMIMEKKYSKFYDYLDNFTGLDKDKYLQFYDEFIESLRLVKKFKGGKLCDIYEITSRIFDYSSFRSSTKSWKRNEFISCFSSRICLFCGRQYLTPYIDSTSTIKHTAEVDHFMPQDKFPYFSLSIGNLTPICSYCNSKKRNIYKIDDQMINPRTISDEDIEFVLFDEVSGREVISISNALSSSIKLKIKIVSRSGSNMEEKIIKSNALIHLEEIYQIHIPEVKVVLKKIQIYNNRSYARMYTSCGSLMTTDDIFNYIMLEITTFTDAQLPLMKLYRNIYDKYFVKFSRFTLPKISISSLI